MELFLILRFPPFFASSLSRFGVGSVRRRIFICQLSSHSRKCTFTNIHFFKGKRSIQFTHGTDKKRSGKKERERKIGKQFCMWKKAIMKQKYKRAHLVLLRFWCMYLVVKEKAKFLAFFSQCSLVRIKKIAAEGGQWVTSYSDFWFLWFGFPLGICQANCVSYFFHIGSIFSNGSSSSDYTSKLTTLTYLYYA